MECCTRLMRRWSRRASFDSESSIFWGQVAAGVAFGDWSMGQEAECETSICYRQLLSGQQGLGTGGILHPRRHAWRLGFLTTGGYAV